MMTVYDRFKEHYQPGYYTRINETHPLDLYIGVDDSGHYSMELRGDFTLRKVSSSCSIGVKQYNSDCFNGIIIYLKDNAMLETFCVFCEDIIKSTETISDNINGYNAIINRYYSWKKMFQNRSGALKEYEIMGLIGELLFLRDEMLPLYGEDTAIQSWSGQELTHKDFSLSDKWFEIKAINYGKQSVKISSFEQLDSQMDGELVVYHLEKMSPAYDGITLNKLATSVLDILTSSENKDRFLSTLSESKFTFDNVYENYVYNLAMKDKFLVSTDFPKLTKDMVPNAICKVQYEILLSEIEEMKIH